LARNFVCTCTYQLLFMYVLRKMSFYTERTILLRDLKFCWIQQIILSNSENNFVGKLKIKSNAAKKFWYFSNFDILIINSSFLRNYFIVQQNYLSDLYSAKILDLLAKSFFSLCNGSTFVSRTEHAGLPDWLVGRVEIRSSFYLHKQLIY